MRITITIFLSVCLLAAPVNAPAREASHQAASPCEDIVSTALSAARRLKPGATRADVEEQFKEDGGMQSPADTVYCFLKCRYIKIRVHFKHQRPESPMLFSKTDVITSVSKPYLESPLMD